MPVIQELVIALGYKTDTKSLDAAAAKARKSAKEAETAYKDAAKKVEEAQEAVRTASDKTAKKVAQDALHAARQTAKASKEAMQATTAAAKQAEKASKDAADAAAASSAKISNSFRGALGGLGKTLGVSAIGGAISGALAGASAVGLGKLVQDFAERGDDIGDLAQNLGVAADQMQRLQYAAERSGGSAEVVNEGIKHLNKGLIEAVQKGTGPAAEGFELLGLKAEEFQGLGIEAQFAKIAEALKDVTDEQTKAAIAGKIFGERSGVELKGLLDRGAEGIQALGDRAEALGSVMSNEAVAAASDLTDAITDVKAVSRGAANEIGMALAPEIKDVAQDFQGWIAENDDLIKQDLPEVARAIADGFGAVGSAIGGVVSVLADAKRGMDAFLDSLEGSQVAQLRAAGVSEDTIAAVQQRTRQRGAPKTLGQARAEAAAKQTTDAEGLSARQHAFNARAAQIAKRNRNKGGSASAKGRAAEQQLTEALFAIWSTGVEDDIRALGLRSDASQAAVDAALKSAAEQATKGASRSVQVGAGRSTLEGLTGQKLQGSDPLLSALFGSDTLPDVPLSQIERGQEPQVLISTINNNVSVSVTQQINGARDPIAVATDARRQFEEMWSSKVEATSKLVKVNFAR